MDNCCAHSISEELTSICVYYLPKNTTYFLQPLDQGIIRNIKVNYQLNLNKKVVSIIAAMLMRKSLKQTLFEKLIFLMPNI